MNAQQFLHCILRNASVEFPATMKSTSALFAALLFIASFAFGGEGHVRRSARPVPGRYIVVLQPDADADSMANKVRSLGSVRNTYVRSVRGFSIDVSDADA